MDRWQMVGQMEGNSYQCHQFCNVILRQPPKKKLHNFYGRVLIQVARGKIF
jgi:hypothetical protein